MVEVFEKDSRTNIVQSSKGNQLKWKNDGLWYKADYLGYEGLAEYVVSSLLQKSTLKNSAYVKYGLETIKCKSVVYNGSKSIDFLTEDWQIITLERLFQNYFNTSLNKAIYQIKNNRDRLQFLVSQVERITGLSNFGIYMNQLFTIDAVFLNEDRHTHNIAVLMNGKGEFQYCPIFDYGAALLSDTKMDYPMGEDIYKLIQDCHAKTICQDFAEQLDVSEQLYGNHLKFSFTRKEIQNLLNQTELYQKEEKERVETILYEQMRRYPYLFI